MSAIWLDEKNENSEKETRNDDWKEERGRRLQKVKVWREGKTVEKEKKKGIF